MSKPFRLLVSLMLVLVLAQACGSDEAAEIDLDATVQANVDATQAAQPTDTPIPPTATPAPTDTPSPTETPTLEPEPTATFTPEAATLSAEELLDRWYSPFGALILLVGACEGVNDTLTQLEADTLSAAELTANQIGIALLVDAADDGLSDWKPSADMANLQTEIGDYISLLEAALGDWEDESLSPLEAVQAMKPNCDNIDSRGEEIALSAEAEGVTETEVDLILTDLSEVFLELRSEMEAALADVEPEATPVPQQGEVRADPYPQGSIASAPNWDFQVLELVRGQEAEDMLLAANEFNEPAPAGQEYLLLKIWAKNTSSEEEALNISAFDFAVTGSALTRYGPTFVLEPDPALEADLLPEGETEGWAVFLISQDESDLLLLIDEVFNFEDNGIRYLSLEDGATISIDPTLADITPTDLGLDRAAPAPLGETVTTENWQITVLESQRGEAAWEAIVATNEFNDPPEDGLEYVLLQVQVRYIGSGDAAAEIIGYDFKATGDEDVVYESPAVVEPDPALNFMLYPGGEVEGWVVVQAAEGESGVIAIFEPFLDFAGEETRYLALE